MSTVWLFDEAWRRRRHRRRAWAAAGAVGVAIVGLAAVRLATSSPPDGAIPRFEPQAELVRPGSYLAIHCPQPNSIGCDQLALAVTLKRPARAITATIDGHSWPMNRWGDERQASSRPRRQFDGYFSHAGIRSRLHVRPEEPGDVFVNKARSPGVRVVVGLLVELPSGQLVSTRLRLYLADGWG